MSKKQKEQKKSVQKKLDEAFKAQDRTYETINKARDNATDLLWSDKLVSLDKLKKFVNTINANLPKLTAASEKAEELCTKLNEFNTEV